MPRTLPHVAAALALFAGSARSQGVDAYRLLAGPEIVSRPMNVSRVMELPNGSVVAAISSSYAAYAALLDSNLHPVRLYLDTVYRDLPGRRGPISLVRLRPDTVLFTEPDLKVFKRVAPDGSMGRIVPFPNPSALLANTAHRLGDIAFDDRMRLVYLGRTMEFSHRNGGWTPTDVWRPDSVPLLRTTMERWVRDSVRHEPASYDTVPARFRRTDTVTFLRQATSPISFAPNSTTLVSQDRPAGFNDLWAVLSTGDVIVVRADTYRLERIASDGKVTVTNVRHDRVPVSLAEKQAFVAERRRAIANPTGPSPFATASKIIPPTVADIPDFLPAVRPFKLHVDLMDRVWVPRFLALRRGGLYYDIVTLAGEVVDRVRLPDNTEIVGFGKGTVFLRRSPSWESLTANSTPPPEPTVLVRMPLPAGR